MAELSLIVKVTLVLVLALLATRLAGGRPASVRSLLLASAFGLLIVLPLASLALPARTIEIPAAYAAPFAPAVVATITPSPVAPIAADVPPSASAKPVSIPSLPTAARWIWAAGAVGFIVPLLVSLLRLRGVRTRGHRWTHASLPSSVEVLLDEELHVPITYGALRPVIVLPTDAPRWSESDLRRVLLHELEHVRRRDWAVLMTARVVCALYWFHPLAWIAWRRLCLEAERACDDAVVREEDGAAYAAQLVSLARRITRRDALPLLSIAGRSNLSTRVGAMLASDVTRGPVGTAAAVAVVTLAVMAALGIGPLQAVTSMPRAQAPVSGLAFESMSIRPIASATSRCCLVRYAADGRMSAANVDLVDLIVSAYGLYRWQVAGAPNWAGGDVPLAPSPDANRFDVQATAPRSASGDDMRLMLKTMLTNRFRLAVHRETRSQKAYELVAEPGGHTLQPPGDRPYIADEDIWLRVDPTSLMATLHVERMTMAELTRNLGGILQTAVVDRTGITGAFRVDARWDANPNRPDVLQPSSGSPRNPQRLTIFEAFPAQLGLRLRQTTSSVEYLLVDNVERPMPDPAR